MKQEAGRGLYRAMTTMLPLCVGAWQWQRCLRGSCCLRLSVCG